jgi:hypothetical protein
MNCEQASRWLPPMGSFGPPPKYEATMDDFYDSFPDFVIPKGSVGDAMLAAHSPVLMMPSGTDGNLSPTTGISNSPPKDVPQPSGAPLLFFEDLQWEIAEVR